MRPRRGRTPHAIASVDPGRSAPAADPAGSEEARPVRLNKLLAEYGIASRRGADELIAAGKVTVDGEPATELGRRVDPARQRVEIDGFVLKPRSARRRYYLLNKPAGVV